MTPSAIVAFASLRNANAESGVTPPPAPDSKPRPAPVALAPGRRRRSPQERAELLARFARSGQSAAAFCRAAGLCAVTFSGWRRRQAQDVANGPVAATSARFAAVHLAPDAVASPGADTPCLVQLPNGIRIAVTSQVEPLWLATVLSHVR